MVVKRRPFQGVLNILSFNRHFYLFGFLALGILLAGLWYLQAANLLFYLVTAGFGYGLLMPLLVSAYVYDFSGYYSFKWLKNMGHLNKEGIKILNINAGFDETSFTINDLFPKAELRVFDFYNAKQHTEPAIVRARKVSMVYPKTEQIVSDRIPLESNSIDAIFLLSAAHEIRNQDEKVKFLTECNRVCKPGASVIMVEHLRDFPNFLAFTIGFTHFFSNKIWKAAFEKADWTYLTEVKFTPFMSVFTFKN